MNVISYPGLGLASIGLMTNLMSRYIGGSKMFEMNNDSGMNKLLDAMSTIVKEKDEEISKLNDRVASKLYEIDKLNDMIDDLKVKKEAPKRKPRTKW